MIAVFLSMLLDSLREGAMPFYAAIAAVIVIQQNRRSSVKAAVNREIATLAGGFFGLAFLILESVFGHAEPPVLRYALLALVLLPLISFSVYIRKTEMTFLMCVVFLSVALLHGGDESPYLFAINRIIDTSIGIGVALAVNEIPRFSAVKKRRQRPPERE